MEHPGIMEKNRADVQTSRNVGKVMWESSFGLSLTHTPLQAHLSEQQRKQCLQRMPRADLQREYFSQAMKSTHLTQHLDSAEFQSHIRQTKAGVPNRDQSTVQEVSAETKMACKAPTAAELVSQCPWAREEGWEVPNAWDNGVHRGRAPGNKKELTLPIGYSPRTAASEGHKGLRKLRNLRSQSARTSRQTTSQTMPGEGRNPARDEVKKEAPASKPPSVPQTLTDFRSTEAREQLVPIHEHESAIPSVERRTTPRKMWRYDDREALFTSVVGRSHFDVMNNLKPVQQRNGRITPRGKCSRSDCGLEIDPCPGMRESKPHPHNHMQTAPVLTTILMDA
eukprot:gnl/MRDRNA2_/MRDRNA2_109458_c0_seq1.p1 gnl/MRDRNA2_/MRDRNA2_109458_c0~~gnl/MRDRNA2_/MRDRNA2_109458_c0_seq1.p1  ORF type:complete len:360 (-),score=55.63 gnl/MRDRNA2_/MRDRNA2_109458_c0_seq1:33-1046(-)